MTYQAKNSAEYRGNSRYSGMSASYNSGRNYAFPRLYNLGQAMKNHPRYESQTCSERYKADNLRTSSMRHRGIEHYLPSELSLKARCPFCKQPMQNAA